MRYALHETFPTLKPFSGVSLTPRPTAQSYLPFSPPLVSEAGVEAVSEVLRSGWIGTGPLAAEFEEKFAGYLGRNLSSAAVSSCTSGLFLSLRALGIGPGDEVITTDMTFVSTVNSILHCGARPVLVDIDPSTGNIDTDQIVAKITPATKAIIPVHYAGYPCDMGQIMSVADEFELYVIEDCAHSVEGKWAGNSTGTFGNASVYSFYATKNVATGEGGMVVSSNSEFVESVAALSLHGLTRGAWSRFSTAGRRTYDVEVVGYKANFTDIQAAIGLSQLVEIEANYIRRREIWDRYTEALSDLNVRLPVLPDADGSRYVLHLYIVDLPPKLDRDSFVEELSEKHRLAFGVHYKAVHQFQLYRKLLGISASDFPVAESWGRSCLSLSLSAGTTDEHVSRVIDALIEELA